MEDTFDSLCDLYEAFCKEHGLNLGSADEMAFEDHDLDGKAFTAAEKEWIVAFVDRWEEMEKRQRYGNP